MIAVLAGDIIKSSRLTPEELQSVKDCIAKTCDELRERFPEIGISKPFFYRGDGWQVAMKLASAALKVAVFIYAGLRHQSIALSRIAIGVGDVEKLDLENLDKSSGEAFERAGHTLDKMNTRSFDIEYSNHENSATSEFALAALASCIAAMMSGWTARQAELAYLSLLNNGETHADLAKALNPPITRQAFTESLQDAKFAAVEQALQAFLHLNKAG